MVLDTEAETVNGTKSYFFTATTKTISRTRFLKQLNADAPSETSEKKEEKKEEKKKARSSRKKTGSGNQNDRLRRVC